MKILTLFILLSNILFSQNNNNFIEAKYYSEQKEVLLPKEPLGFKIIREKGSIVVVITNKSEGYLAVGKSCLSNEITFLDKNYTKVADAYGILGGLYPSKMNHLIVKPSSQMRYFSTTDSKKKYEFIDLNLKFTVLCDNRFITCKMKVSRLKPIDEKSPAQK